MKKVNYMKRASQRFLQGTKFRSPFDAVESGMRSLADWADMLSEERERESELNRMATKRLRSNAAAA
jgi:hypothetical protein